MRSVLALLLIGCAAETGEATWTQVGTSGLDILWVVDNSASMGEEQDILGSGFLSFVNELDEDDVRIAVTSTSFDATLGGFEGDTPYLTPQDDDFLAEFAGRARIGINGGDKEKGLEASIAALRDNEGDFMRPETLLVVVYVSDEEDCSDGGMLDGEPPEECYKQLGSLPPVADYIEELRNVKGTPESVLVGAIVGPRDACEDSYPGRRYWAAAYQTGGLVGNICEADWSRFMEDLGASSTGGLRRRFAVNERPMEDTLVVSVGNKEVDGWAWDDAACAIVFEEDAAPEDGAKISAAYEVDPDARKCDAIE
ncbi:MAG: hypothetical protein ACI8PZ_005631 [Myxococcota bacterium]|jgi:hypothetical protein